jgi:hypothetical protein
MKESKLKGSITKISRVVYSKGAYVALLMSNSRWKYFPYNYAPIYSPPILGVLSLGQKTKDRKKKFLLLL